jgi:hypothetical protein
MTRPASLLDCIDSSCPEQRAIAFYILKERQKRKLAESVDRKREAR